MLRRRLLNILYTLSLRPASRSKGFISNKRHCVKYLNFTYLCGVEILWKRKVSAEFQVLNSKLCGNCAFPINFHTRKLGAISVFYAVRFTRNHLSNYQFDQLSNDLVKHL